MDKLYSTRIIGVWGAKVVSEKVSQTGNLSLFYCLLVLTANLSFVNLQMV